MKAWAGLLVAGLVAVPAASVQDPRRAPWPDAAELTRLRQDAQGRRLFASSEPLVFKLVADFKAVNRDRNPDSTQTFPATAVGIAAGSGVGFFENNEGGAGADMDSMFPGYTRNLWTFFTLPPTTSLTGTQTINFVLSVRAGP